MSAAGWLVSRVGAPPASGIVYTSVLPSYWALKAIVWPSGAKTGCDSTPMSEVSRRGFFPSRSATHRSSAYTKAMFFALTAGMVKSRVSVGSGSADAGAAQARNQTETHNQRRDGFMAIAVWGREG